MALHDGSGARSPTRASGSPPTAKLRKTRTASGPACGVVVAIVLLVAGCASGGGSTEKPSPSEKALRASQKRVVRSLEDAFERSEKLDDYTVRARYNPPKCDGPDFEVFAHGKWTRAYLDAKSELQEKIEGLKPDDEMVGGGEAITFRGEWNGMRKAETGLEFPVFWVVAIE